MEDNPDVFGKPDVEIRSLTTRSDRVERGVGELNQRETERCPIRLAVHEKVSGPARNAQF